MSFEGFGEDISTMSFDRLLELVRPRITFYCHGWEGHIKDYEYDDVFQLLSIRLWKMYEKNKFPHMVFDYRTTRYIDQAFRNEIYQEWRSKIPRGQYLKKNLVPKDAYYHSSHL